MSKEDKKAADLKDEVRMSDYEDLQYQKYEDEHVKQSVIHTRQDVVLLVSYASSIVKILNSLKQKNYLILQKFTRVKIILLFSEALVV